MKIPLSKGYFLFQKISKKDLTMGIKWYKVGHNRNNESDYAIKCDKGMRG